MTDDRVPFDQLVEWDTNVAMLRVLCDIRDDLQVVRAIAERSARGYAVVYHANVAPRREWRE